ncbi:MAG: DoxX family protein [Propionibacteriaceae bacterium]
MDILAWILCISLAGTYLGVGLIKLIQPRAVLMKKANFGWAADYTDANVKGIGLAEVLGAIGVIVPWATMIAPVLTPVAALGLAALQVGAVRTHLRRGETKVVPGNVLLLLIAVVAAVIRFTQL